jgi:hypothetical protein
MFESVRRCRKLAVLCTSLSDTSAPLSSNGPHRYETCTRLRAGSRPSPAARAMPTRPRRPGTRPVSSQFSPCLTPTCNGSGARGVFDSVRNILLTAPAVGRNIRSSRSRESVRRPTTNRRGRNRPGPGSPVSAPATCSAEHVSCALTRTRRAPHIGLSAARGTRRALDRRRPRPGGGEPAARTPMDDSDRPTGSCRPRRRRTSCP